MKTKSEFRNIAAMLSDEIVSVACTFHTGGKEYTYKAERTLELNKGDLVVVSANDGGYKVVTVVDAHKDCMLEDADTVDYQWVLSVVSPARLEELQAWEDKIADDLYYQQRAHAKKQMLAALGFDGVASLPTGLPAPEESSEVIDEE